MNNSPGLPKFEDFDDQDVYRKIEHSIFSADSLNFVIEFDIDTAVAATDVSAGSIRELLKEEYPPTKTRWINLWCPERQTDTVKELARCYGFSPRLTGLMCCQPNQPLLAGSDPEKIGRSMMTPRQKQERNSIESRSTDVEKNPKVERPADLAMDLDLDLNHYNIINEVWYYCSVDYLCIGYNSLSQLHATALNDDEPEEQISNKPQGRRLWTWLIHCNDGTIIAIHENPYPSRQGGLTKAQINNIMYMRKNLVTVVKQLSKSNEHWRQEHPITTLPIRCGLQNMVGSELGTSDAPSLLFYYLFDDWHTSYSLVARKEHQYSKQLGLLRERMSKKPEVKHVQRLHHIGQQLAVLKRIYQSYELIIERILDRQKPVELSNSTHLLQEGTGEHTAKLTAQSNKYAVPLSSAATVRFERLRDRINLYALGEIQDCLDEKEQLNFNLITLKQSAAVERLTRITILLAKVTILFMPVSLMTGYFSVQIDDIQGKYTSTTYWAAFAIIMALSFMFLLVFGKISGTVEGEAIYQSFTQIFWSKSRDRLRSRRARNFAYTPEGGSPL